MKNIRCSNVEYLITRAQVYQAVLKYVQGSTFIVSQPEQPEGQVFPEATFCKYILEGVEVAFREMDKVTMAEASWIVFAIHDGNV